MEISTVSLTPMVKFPGTTNTTLKDKTEEKSAEWRREQKASLMRNFGGLKGQRNHTMFDKVSVDTETLKRNIGNVLETLEGNVGDLSLPMSVDVTDTLLPPRNADASHVSDITRTSDLHIITYCTCLVGFGRLFYRRHSS